MSFWQDRNVFITGCTGLLGSWLTDKLIGLNANITGLIRDYVPGANFYKLGCDRKITSVRGKAEDFLLVKRLLNEYEIDTVFHLAAQPIVGIANRSPLSTFESNIQGTWSLLEACRQSPLVKRIIIASSDKAYGSHKKLPYREDFALCAEHPYDVSKSCADLIAQAYYRTYRLPVCVTRCGNFYGGGDLNFNRIVPGTIRSALRNKPVIIRSDGKFVRDYIYIEDVVNAYLLLAEKMERSKLYGGSFNFSNEEPLNVIELAKKILALMLKKKLKIRILNEASNEIRLQYLSSLKARKMLGWKPQYSLESGLKETIRWYKEYFARK